MRFVVSLLAAFVCLATPGLAAPSQPVAYAGSSSCQECHQRFYQLWSTSMHGLAMQPYTPALAKARLTPQQQPLTVDRRTYRADLDRGVVLESGADGARSYRIEHVLGGKNVFYFLTALERGRLQTLPVAYDVHAAEWFDTAGSGVRHFPSGEQSEAVSWKDAAYTFNTACYGCHVSQVSTNYDAATRSYHTTWTEPGINCETCHGSAVEHNALARATPAGEPLSELRLISTKVMTVEQRNDLCASCHAKAQPLTQAFPPGERFFDHFDLVTLEDPDYYPDGRDLGENYSFTSWRMSPCAASGRLDCLHCHTSSGRYRYAEGRVNDPCAPCHQAQLDDPRAHSHHDPQGAAGTCIACHMPMTSFARMRRSDHSMLPPAPAATLAYGSPNACTLCHADRDAAWADAQVRRWHARDYQAPVLHRAALVAAAREGKWSQLSEMLAYLRAPGRDEVTATSLIRLMSGSADARIAPVLVTAMSDPSALVRGAAADGLASRLSPAAVQALVKATGDEHRLVRVRAAAALTGHPAEQLAGAAQASFAKAEREYLAGLTARPDQWSSHYNLGNYRLNRGEAAAALAAFAEALALEPTAVPALVNASLAHAQRGEVDAAERALRQALALEPDNAAANLNLGLLKAEHDDPQQAEALLKRALTADPQLAQAAYNLCVLVAQDRLPAALPYCRQAAELAPERPSYAYTLAFYLDRHGQRTEAIRTLEALLAAHPEDRDAQLLLSHLTTQQRGR